MGDDSLKLGTSGPVSVVGFERVWWDVKCAERSIDRNIIPQN